MKIDTLRLILFLDCNFSCKYCCNKLYQFSTKGISEIDFSKYKNICISGGEIFLKRDILYKVLRMIPDSKKIYLYTNGVLINNSDIELLKNYNIAAINIGIHTINQIPNILPVEEVFNTRFSVENIKYQKLIKTHPKRLANVNIKTWEMDDCDMPNEEWVLLQGEI